MNILSHVHAFFYTYTYFITWRALVEIIFFSALFYHISLWLKRDHHRNLLGYWYGYCLLGFGAYCLQLNTISSVLFFFTPAIIMLFLIMHQEQLQKNFVALRNLTPARSSSSDWLEQLMRSCVVAINNNKSLVCVIERNDSLQDFLTAPFIFNAELHSATLNMLIMSTPYESSKLVWINDKGTLRGLNASWNKTNEDIIHNAHQVPTWQEDALFFTAKTDAITVGVDSKDRSFTIITRGKCFEHIAAHNALKFIKKLVTLNELGALSYELSEQSNRHKQPHA